MKITSVIRTLEKKQEELTKELRNVGAAIAALSGNTVRSLDSRARRKISRALKRAWRKRKKLRA
jgi:uroporphyrinogen-III synthase